MLPWALYNLTPRDQGSPLIRPFNFQFYEVAAGPQAYADTVCNIPDEYICLVTAICIWTSGGVGAGNVSDARFLIEPTGTTGTTLFEARHTYESGLKICNHTWTGSQLAMVHDKQRIRLAISLTGANTNIPWLGSVHGCLIPHGTMGS